MAAPTRDLALDRAQVKKAVQALQAFLKSKSTPESLFLDEAQQISILITLWRIPKKTQTIRIPLPHGQSSDVDEVCLFTRDEPNMTADQTKRFYKKLLEERGVQNVAEVIPYTELKTEYKPFEAKRRLLGNYDSFLADERIIRLLCSQLGKHFYARKRDPLQVDLQSKHLARDIKNLVQGSRIKITNKGCCCMARIAHSAMTADEVTDNIEAAVKTIVAKLPMKGPVIKIIHLKSQASVALPIFTSDLSHLTILKDAKKLAKGKGKAQIAAKNGARKDQTKSKGAALGKKKLKEQKVLETEEAIPQLVPIVMPSKKPKLEKPLVKAPKSVQKKGPKAQNKKAGKIHPQKQKRKSPKSKRF